MWWPPAESIGGLLFLSSFLFFAGGLNNEPQQTRKEREIDKKNHTTMASKLYFLGMTMYHFLSAMVDGPGYLPLGWKPKEVLKLYQIFLLLE